MIRPHVALKDFDIVPATDLLNLLPHLLPDLTTQHRLAILRAEHEMTVHRVHRMG